MKKFCLLFVLILIVHFTKCQNNKHHLEIGSTFFTLNSLSDNTAYQKKPSYNILNGVIIRYHLNKISVRVLSNFSEGVYDNDSPSETSPVNFDHGSNREFSIGFGAQYNLLKTKDWLYTFTDILYRTVHSQGVFIGDFSSLGPVQYDAVGNGLDSYIGMGAQLKVYKKLYFSPEIAFNFMINKIQRTEAELGSSVSTTQTFNITEFDINHVIKLHLSIRF